MRLKAATIEDGLSLIAIADQTYQMCSGEVLDVLTIS